MIWKMSLVSTMKQIYKREKATEMFHLPSAQKRQEGRIWLLVTTFRWEQTTCWIIFNCETWTAFLLDKGPDIQQALTPKKLFYYSIVRQLLSNLGQTKQLQEQHVFGHRKLQEVHNFRALVGSKKKMLGIHNDPSILIIYVIFLCDSDWPVLVKIIPMQQTYSGDEPPASTSDSSFDSCCILKNGGLSWRNQPPAVRTEPSELHFSFYTWLCKLYLKGLDQ